MLQRKLFFWVSLIFLVSIACPAQQPSPDKAKADAAKAEREKKGWGLLDELLVESQSLKLLENRSYVLVQAADLLWEKDEMRARALLQEASSLLTETMSSIKSDDLYYYNRIQSPNQLRYQMLQIVAKRDTQLAMEFLRTTRAPKAPEQNAYSTDPEAQMELQIASLIAQKDPKHAAQIAEEHIEKDAPPGAVQIIQQLQSKDPDAAVRLTSKLIQKLKSEDILKSYQTVQVTGLLLSMIQLDYQQKADNQRSLMNEQDKKEIVEMMITAALKTTANGPEQATMQQQARQTLQQYLSLVEKYVPTQASALRKIAVTSKSTNPHEKTIQEYNQLRQKGTLEQMLDFAKNASPEMRSQFYAQAVWKAANEGDVERAREIINTHVPVTQRRDMLENLDTRQMHRLANEGKVEEARRAIAHLQPDERKAMFLLQLLDMVADKADKKTLLPILVEVRSLIGQRADNQAEFGTQMQLLNKFVQFDPERGFEMFDPFIKQLNSWLAAAETLDGVEQRFAFSLGEMRLLSDDGVVATILSQFTETLAQAGGVDFDRAKNIADRFDRRETRVLTRLAIVRKFFERAEK